MKIIKIIAGITWAFLCLIIIILLFPGLDSFSSSAAKLPFMKINPNFTGGEVEQQLISQSCTLSIRKPVFDGLIKERKKGFVQLDWRGNLPDKLNDTIDYNLDGIPDFHIMVDRILSITDMEPISDKVKNVNTSTRTSYGWAVRVGLTK
jgi:hypothetical protein